MYDKAESCPEYDDSNDEILSWNRNRYKLKKKYIKKFNIGIVTTMLKLMLEEHIKYYLTLTMVKQHIIQFYAATSMYDSEITVSLRG